MARRHFLRLQAKFVQDQVLALAHRFSVAHIDISSHLKCAVVHELQGHLNQAILGCRKACELSGNRPVMLSLLGHALAKSGETAEAEGDNPNNSSNSLNSDWISQGLRRNIHLLSVPPDRAVRLDLAASRFKNIQSLLRHVNSKVTMDVYAHPLE